MEHLVKDGLKLGFGMMRLPREGKEIDIEKTKEMVDAFMAAGGKYFDTAYVYEGSEEAVGKALCSRYPRDSYYLATKLNAGDFCCKSEEEAKKEIEVSLERTGAGYIDFYLVHGVESSSIDNYDKYGIWDFVKKLKEEGIIKHYGFSFHDSPEMLDKVLTDHPDAEFVQLQINYVDKEDPGVQSRRNYETAVKHGKPIIVMEPVKGGLLAEPPKEIADMLKAADPDASPSSWAVRYAASLPGVDIVLSGMSTIEQVNDNISYMKDFKPLNEDEFQLLEKARGIYESMDRIPCTSCRYCTPGCPMEIHIPDIFSVVNLYKTYGNLEKAKIEYRVRPIGPRASECVACGQCESACPQHLPIIDLLKEAAALLED